MDGLRAKLFPEIHAAWQLFGVDGDWQHIEAARSACWKNQQQVAASIRGVAKMIGADPDENCISRFNSEVLVPLGLEGSEKR
jgi:hypothetical protein